MGSEWTSADLDYHGSITLDPEHCEAAGIYPLEFVEKWNKNAGARISTSVIFGDRGSRCCIKWSGGANLSDRRSTHHCSIRAPRKIAASPESCANLMREILIRRGDDGSAGIFRCR